MSPERSKKILEDIFQHLPKFEVILAGKGFIARSRESFDDLPPFDVVTTGNMEVIRRMEKFGIKARYVKRTKGLRGWTGRELRAALWP